MAILHKRRRWSVASTTCCSPTPSKTRRSIRMPDPVMTRQDIYRQPATAAERGVIHKPLSTWERVYNLTAVRKVAILLLLAAAWEIYARWLINAWTSIKVLLIGYSAGIALAGLLTVIAISSRIGTDFLETLTAMFNPLPAIALLPLALIWFGLGDISIIFVLVHSVLWAVALNTHSGFRSVSNTLRMVGRNYGLKGPRYIAKILIPAAFPSIFTG